MVTQIDPISTPPTPADTPSVFEEKASQVWADLHRAVPQMNQLAQDANDAASAANLAKQSAQRDSDAALGYRNEASSARATAVQKAGEASSDALSAVQSAAQAEAEKKAAQGYAASINPDAWNARISALENRKRAQGDGQSRSTGKVANTTYTNWSGRPISVEAVAATTAPNAWIGIYRNGVFASAGHAPAGSIVTAVLATVLHGETWSVAYDAASVSSVNIQELS